ncbi:hypothetical protein [Methylobacterium persicinum]|uniref:Uncharacterized protein n=1 Tax=Methylobacterium persicinum TaxID=374426 RepID=A0ABU0HNY4_9HYPH|nr:hypothetical protein [Methylobacterium persicinum]MDQ0444038.1 hypothetical protein [Methylobacterium persicinum]GJE38414.1 hypothetical protein KHHGKMAE_2486 [Methylobacterium persicinum]
MNHDVCDTRHEALIRFERAAGLALACEAEEERTPARFVMAPAAFAVATLATAVAATVTYLI